MKPHAHALLAALLTHALTHAYTPIGPSPLNTPVPYLPAANAFEYDYSADVEAQERILVHATTQQAALAAPRDPLEDAREMAKLNIMDRILIALGPNFGKELPRMKSDAVPTVSTPINMSTAPCPYKYKRCSSQTFFPTCEIPKNTAPDIWPQRFNLYFNLSADFGSNQDVINATLRLYKNNSLPLARPKTLLIQAFFYTKSLTKRRDRKKLVADVQISSDYLGWVTLPVPEMVKRWKRQKNNHGVLVSVTDVDRTHWDAPRIFVIMDCVSGVVPLPFEVQTEQEGQQYPSLNVRLGSPDDTLDPDLTPQTTPRPNTHAHPAHHALPSPFSTLAPPMPTMQGDDPELYDYDYEADLEGEEEKEREVEGLEEEVEDVDVEEQTDRTLHLLRDLHPQQEEEEAEEEEEEESRYQESSPDFLLHRRHHHHHRHQGRAPPPPPPTTTTTAQPRPTEDAMPPAAATTTPPPPPPPSTPPQDPPTNPPAPPAPARVSFRGSHGRRGGGKNRKRNRQGHRRG